MAVSVDMPPEYTPFFTFRLVGKVCPRYPISMHFAGRSPVAAAGRQGVKANLPRIQRVRNCRNLASLPARLSAHGSRAAGNAGGLSGAQFWRLVAPRGALGLRCWPTEHPSPERLDSSTAVLRHAAVAASTFCQCRLRRVAGQRSSSTPAISGNWRPGCRGGRLRPSPSVEKLRAAMTALAKFHVAVADFPRPPTARLRSAQVAGDRCSRLTRLHELHARRHRELSARDRRQILARPRAARPPIRRRAARAPSRTRSPNSNRSPNIPFPLQPCLRDIWHDHVLFTGDKVTGLVDFGAIDIDTPATDIARLLGSLGPATTRQAVGETGPRQPTSAGPTTSRNDESRAVHALDTSRHHPRRLQLDPLDLHRRPRL